jgi:hypothetical protein
MQAFNSAWAGYAGCFQAFTLEIFLWDSKPHWSCCFPHHGIGALDSTFFDR